MSRRKRNARRRAAQARRQAALTDRRTTPPFEPFDPGPERGRRWLSWGVLWVLMLVVGYAAAGGEVEPPIVIEDPVTDLEGVIAPSALAEADALLRAHRDATGVQIAVLVIDSTGMWPIEDFSHRVAEAWGGGEAGLDNGVLFTLAINDRRMRIEVGRGLEYQLTDGEAARIIDSLPELLRDERYGDAVLRALGQLVAETGGDATEFEAVSGAPIPSRASITMRSPGLLDELVMVFGPMSVSAPRIMVAIGWLLWILIGVRWVGALKNPWKQARVLSKSGALHYLGFVPVILAPMLAGLMTVSAKPPMGAFLFSGFGLMVGLFLVWWGRGASIRYWRAQPRPCTDGEGVMVRIDPESPEADLGKGRLTEIAILSREYDVWRCPNGHIRVQGFDGSAPADQCPKCGRHTWREGAWKTTREPTYSRTGRRRRTDRCAHCNHTQKLTETVARKSRTVAASSSSSSSGWSSSSSSSSSWSSGGSSGGDWGGGGGSFGGGGASGSW